MSREAQVRFWEGLGAKFPGATHPERIAFAVMRGDEQAVPLVGFFQALEVPGKEADTVEGVENVLLKV